jgi:LacI family transcriptional regulator
LYFLGQSIAISGHIAVSPRAQSRGVPHVLLLIETSVAYGRGLVEGIARYALENGPWSVQFEGRGLDSLPPKWLKNWRGDGIISRTISLKTARLLRATHLPVVEMHGSSKIGVSQVRVDFDMVVRMATDHLLSSGLRHFAYFTCGQSDAVKEQYAAFRSALESRGFGFHAYPAPVVKEIVPHWDERWRPNVAKWVRTLPRPVGVFTPADSHAVRLLDVCRELNVAVPEELALLGMGNDPVICETLRPTLSSLDLNAARIGYEAARLLDRKMAGRQSNDVVRVPPSHVAVRQSTDLMVMDDADMVRAMQFVREFACTGIDISRVAEEVGLSLSVLQRRFHKYLGRTPKSEIMRVQIEHAKRLLSQTDRSCESVAKKSGFTSLTSFTRAFHRETGTTPNAYRRMRTLSK